MECFISQNNGSSKVQVLIVEDHAFFRRLISSMLSEHPGLHIACEVADGLEAVQQAEILQPGLVMLDIGLPRLNGIEVARRIRKLSPKSRILFLTNESLSEVAQEALTLGTGYVLKANAETELLPAVEAVLREEQFIGSGVTL